MRKNYGRKVRIGNGENGGDGKERGEKKYRIKKYGKEGIEKGGEWNLRNGGDFC